ncbi:MAG: neutral/alkaline non-lysosomal ceramidase N-terminal domain-containing protein [Spirochaetales bacterium]|nr:neutral/alkaline non-lysosomal ceramidase N-terminal domain-containing protein [Spirochaetales bacterium]
MLKTAIARADITPRESVPLMGYGDRTHNSEGVHDPLFAYAWWLEPEGCEPLVWIVLDLCLMSPSSAGRLARVISGQTGIDPDRILLSMTHTHSGPDTVFIGLNDEPWAERYYRLLIEACTRAVRSARSRAFPGRIELRTARSDLGVNRRDTARPIDPRVVLLSLVDETGSEKGFLFHYSCHLTVLGVDNYRISADWLGPVRGQLEEELGMPVMFLQGAEGNVDPVSRGALDMADPDQAVGSSFEVLDELAGGMIAALRRGRDSGAEATLDALSVQRRTAALPLRYGGLSREQVQERIERWKESFAGFLEIPGQEVPEDWSINALIKEQARRKGLGDAETRKWVAEQFTYTSFIGIYRIGGELIDSGKGRIPCPATVLDFGALKILGVPMEVLLDVAFDWQRRFEGSIALVCGLFGGWIGYLPHRSNHEEPLAGQRYETVSTMFAPDASLELLETAERMVR